MSKINLLLTLLSLNALLVIIERVSPTTRIILQPYSFLRVHEVFQMTVVIMLSFIISFLLLKVITNNFETLKTRWGTILGIIFTLGVYFTATGNGLHEVVSFLYNTFCNTRIIGSGLCGASFFDDYYFGNVVYFVGLALGAVSLILLEAYKPINKTTTSQTVITIANGALYALTLFAYAAFDRVLVGFWFVLIMAIVVTALVLLRKNKLNLTPFALYNLTAYTLATILTAAVRFH